MHLLHGIFLLWLPIVTEEEKPQLRKIIRLLKEKESETKLAKNCFSVTSLSRFKMLGLQSASLWLVHIAGPLKLFFSMEGLN